MAKVDGITLDGEPFEIDDDDENDEPEESLGEKPEATPDRNKRKEELESELKGLDEEAQADAEDIAEEISEENPEKGQVAAESRDAAEQIAGEYKLSKDAEDKLANAITQKVLENLRSTGSPKKEKGRVRTPDKRPKPTHFSERTLFGKRGDR